jgi:hypothetical protein
MQRHLGFLDADERDLAAKNLRLEEGGENTDSANRSVGHTPWIKGGLAPLGPGSSSELNGSKRAGYPFVSPDSPRNHCLQICIEPSFMIGILSFYSAKDARQSLAMQAKHCSTRWRLGLTQCVDP